MRLLYAACLHQPEDFERFLLPYLKKRCEVLLFDYRVHDNLLWKVNEILPDLVRAHGVTHVLIMKGELFDGAVIGKVREMGIPVACWTIDDHEHFEQFQKPFSTIFTPSPGLINRYHENGYDHVYELPFYVEPNVFRGPPSGNSGDVVSGPCLEDDSLRAEVSFLGTRYPGREPKITLLREHAIPVKLYGDQWTIQNEGRLAEYTDCLKLWHQTKVNLNIHQPTMRDVNAANTKVYEIPAAGGFMLVDSFQGISDKFSSDEVATYEFDSNESLYDAVRYWLDDSESRNEIMTKAREHIFHEHTAEKRAAFILSKL